MDKRTYVVPRDHEDLRYLASFGDIPVDDDSVYVCWDSRFFQGLRFFEGDRLIIGQLYEDDDRRMTIQNSLTMTGHWVNVGMFTDVVLSKPKIPKQ